MQILSEEVPDLRANRRGTQTSCARVVKTRACSLRSFCPASGKGALVTSCLHVMSLARATRCAAAATILVTGPASLQPTGYQGPPFELARVAEGVYVTQFTTPDGAGLTGNGIVIVNDSDVVVVDSHNTPATAQAVIAKIRKITKLPVRYVINTHWHGDHMFGNSEYQREYPGVDFIAHPYTREDFVKEELPGLAGYVNKGLPDEIAGLRNLLTTGKSSSGAPLTDAQRGRVNAAIEQQEWLLRQLQHVRPVLPTITVADSLVLHRGARTIVVRFLGRGNTRGDLTVYLPREQVLITGDLLVHPMPYAVDSYLGEWVRVLQLLRAMPATVIVPGHGQVQHDRAYLDLVSSLLESTLSQARQAVAKGLDLEATRKAVNLDSLRTVFTGGDVTRNPVFDGNYTTPAVAQAWREARGELAPAK